MPRPEASSLADSLPSSSLSTEAPSATGPECTPVGLVALCFLAVCQRTGNIAEGEEAESVQREGDARHHLLSRDSFGKLRRVPSPRRHALEKVHIVTYDAVHANDRDDATGAAVVPKSNPLTIAAVCLSLRRLLLCGTVSVRVVHELWKRNKKEAASTNNKAGLRPTRASATTSAKEQHRRRQGGSSWPHIRLGHVTTAIGGPSSVPADAVGAATVISFAAPLRRFGRRSISARG
ncbi:hypothetical protein MRX96_039834 [Rhipicephalus microplus]